MVAAIASALVGSITVAEPAAPRDRLREIASQVLGAGHLSASFTEEKSLAIMSEVLVSRGRFEYDAPDRFVWETLEPVRSRLTVEGDDASLVRGGRERSVDLSMQPLAARFVTLTQRLAVGDLDALRASFEIEIRGDSREWVLHLTPLATADLGDLEHVQMRGENDVLRSLHLRFGGGDTTHIVFEDVVRDDRSPGSAPR